MAEISTVRLNVALRELNISLDRAVEFLAQQNIEIKADLLPKFLRTFTNYSWMSLKQINPRKTLPMKSVRRKERRKRA